MLIFGVCFRVVIPLCGGNIDTTVLGRCLERGLAADGRLLRFVVTVSDRPGGIAELTKLIASIGVRWVGGAEDSLCVVCSLDRSTLTVYGTEYSIMIELGGQT